MFRTVLVAGLLALGLAAIPAKVSLTGGTLSISGSDAVAQSSYTPRYQPGNSACRDGAGRRC